MKGGRSGRAARTPGAIKVCFPHKRGAGHWWGGRREELLERSQPGLQWEGDRKTSASRGGLGIGRTVRCLLKLKLFDAHGTGVTK